jgi:phosphatidylserine synthase
VWLRVGYSACLTVYCVLDNLDGQHARSTGQTSKLGELLDHCTDALIIPLYGAAGSLADSSAVYCQCGWNRPQGPDSPAHVVLTACAPLCVCRAMAGTRPLPAGCWVLTM